MTVELLRYTAPNATPAARGVDFGAAYKAARQPDGNWSILGIDIFKACERPNPQGGLDKFDEEFLNGAVATFEEQRSGGHLPPVHLDHHSPTGASQPYAGKIGKLWVDHDTKGVAVLRANIIDIPPQVFAEIQLGRLPYRSVEVNNPRVKAISSLALMATRVPYHKLPLTGPCEIVQGVHFAEFRLPDPRTGARMAIVQPFAPDNAAAVAAMTEPTKGRLAFNDWFGRLMGKQKCAEGDDDTDDGDPPRDDGEDMGDDAPDFAQGLSPEDIQALLQQLQQGGGDPGAEGVDDGGDPSMQDDPGAAAAAPGMQPQADPMTEIAPLLQELLAGQQQMLQALTSMNQGVAQAQMQPGNPPPSMSAEANGAAAHFSANGRNGAAPKGKATGAAPAPAPAPAPKAAAAATAPAPSVVTPSMFAALADRVAQLAEQIKPAIQFCEQLARQMEEQRVFDEVSTHLGTKLREHAEQMAKDRYTEAQIVTATETVAKFLDKDVQLAFAGQVDFAEIDPSRYIADWREQNPPDTSVASRPPAAPASSAAPRAQAVAKARAVEQANAAQKFLETTKHPDLKALHDENPAAFAENFTAFCEAWDRADERVRALNEGSRDEFIKGRMLQLTFS